MGFVNGPVFDEARSGGRLLLTIAHHVTPGIPFYEAVECPRQSGCMPEFGVMGMWLPLYREAFRIDQVGALMVHDRLDHHAFVV